jgi:two-component sensor histidine kinase
MSNAVWHGYRDHQPGTIELEAEARAPDTLFVTVADDGEGMSPHPDAGGRGLGLSLIGYLAEGFEVGRRNPHGTTVRMRFPLSA